jgi:hypothetical protein
VGLGIAMPFFVQGKPEHVAVEACHRLGLVGDEDDSGDEMDIFWPLWRAAGHRAPPAGPA